MDMMNMTMNSTTMTMQMSFYWGRNVTILFSKWPGNDQHNPGMYILALFFVFAIAFAMEPLSVWPTIKPSGSSVVAGLAQAFLYAIRISLGYFVMLAVMSYNIGIFIAAVAGHTVGFFVAKASALSITKPPGPEPSF
ncbi:putative Ctr copper transporter [Rosa chinensis]|uniref:Copper transport protein n=2 Tax=Rosa chinensis TaxID=74649 RepID=A0A2P6R9G9_ROSCH|nr:putative Ctr copper transporter [Rosa chinensis]